MLDDPREKLAKLRALAPAPASDNINLIAQSAADDRGIIGVRLKFDKGGSFLDRDGVALPSDFQAIVFDIRECCTKWKDNFPSQKIWRVSGKHFPKREELDDLDRNQWENPNKDPWQFEYYLVVAERKTGDLFTLVTSSGGGKVAVRELAWMIHARRHSMPGARAVVAFKSVLYSSRYNSYRPNFVVIEWLDGSGQTIAAAH